MKLIATRRVKTWAIAFFDQKNFKKWHLPRYMTLGMTLAWALSYGIGLSLPAHAQFDASKGEIGESKPFDPSACKFGDKKYVYWAAKDQVFRFNFEPKEPLYPRGWWVNQPGNFGVAQREVPPAPNPVEPEGCLQNPLRAGSAPYMYEFAKTTYRQIFGREWYRAGHGSIENGFRAVADGGLWRYSSHRNRNSKHIKESTDCWNRSPGLSECLVSQGTNRADYRINRSLKIDKEFLNGKAETADLYFFASPGPYPWSQATGQDLRMAYITVENLYLLYGCVGLESSFHIFPTELEKMIPFYSALIHYVTSAYVADYSWQPKPSAAPKHVK